jgi:hypothetical protein
MCPGLRAENIPKYKVIQSPAPDKTIFFPISITRCETSLNDAIRNKIIIEEYLTNYKRSNTTKYVLKNQNPKPKVKRVKLVLKEESEDDENAEVLDEDERAVALLEKEKEEEEEEEEEIKIPKTAKDRGKIVIKRNTKKRRPQVKLVIEE